MAEAGIQKLLEAEEEAAKIVQAARVARNKRLAAADAEAAGEIERFRAEMEAKFQAEMSTGDEGSDGHERELEEEAKRETEALTKGYEENKKTVQDLMLHYVCAVDLTLTHAQKQAMAKMARD